MRPTGGSRFLYEPLEYGPKEVREAQEKVLQMQFEGIDMRLTRIEALMERLERRLWLAVYGVVAAVLVQAFQPIMAALPG